MKCQGFGILKVQCLLSILLEILSLLTFQVKPLPVEIANVDMENGVVTFTVPSSDGATRITHSVGQIFESDGSFTLVVTYENGQRYNLGFVRSIPDSELF